MSDLKSCPFCGEKLFRYGHGESASVAGRHPISGNCIAKGIIVIYGQEERWNTRASADGGQEKMCEALEEVSTFLWSLNDAYAVDLAKKCVALSSSEASGAIGGYGG